MARISINNQTGGLAEPTYIEKWWGYELIYKNDTQYCCKLLHFNKGGHTSMHFHVAKHETLVVASGTLKLEYIKNGNTYEMYLKQGQAFIMVPGIPHRLIAEKAPVDVFEASTLDREDDSVRIDTTRLELEK